jgi:hypothetical protein
MPAIEVDAIGDDPFLDADANRGAFGRRWAMPMADPNQGVGGRAASPGAGGQQAGAGEGEVVYGVDVDEVVTGRRQVEYGVEVAVVLAEPVARAGGDVAASPWRRLEDRWRASPGSGTVPAHRWRTR